MFKSMILKIQLDTEHISGFIKWELHCRIIWLCYQEIPTPVYLNVFSWGWSDCSEVSSSLLESCGRENVESLSILLANIHSNTIFSVLLMHILNFNRYHPSQRPLFYSLQRTNLVFLPEPGEKKKNAQLHEVEMCDSSWMIGLENNNFVIPNEIIGLGNDYQCIKPSDERRA